MDYRSSVQDDEHPVGASPWGSSPPASPRRNESSFTSQRSYSSLRNETTVSSQDGHNGISSEDPSLNAFQQPGTASTGAPPSEPDTLVASDPSPQQPFGGTSSQRNSGQYGESQQRPHGDQVGTQVSAGQDQQQRQNYPQYKLQAKITGLERTGRKDPVLRFDVHVCWHASLIRGYGG
jgi:hypothetical protein